MTHLLYALVITFGSLIDGKVDLYFTDAILYPTMEACEKDKMIQINATQENHSWVTIVRGACTPTQSTTTSR